MKSLGLVFHHLGLAVRQAEESVLFLSKMGYSIGTPVTDPLQKVQLMMCSHPTEPAVEIICSGPDPQKGPVNEMIKKNPFGIIYHVCYATSNLAETLAQAELLELPFFCISEPKPAILFGGQKVSFYKVQGIGLVEILETTALTNNPLEEGPLRK
jgi:hypothetical protein